MKLKYDNIKVIAFDADDTLWVNETYFREAEAQVAELLSNYETPNKTEQELYKIEIQNLPVYGYGVKGFVLSMVELALKLSNYKVPNSIIASILDIGKAMINKPVEVLEDVELVLKTLSKSHRLIVVTKGDLLDQERKLEKSGLLHYFHHIEVLSEKNEIDYSKLLKRLDVDVNHFLMVGNSLKSDILPVVGIGATAIHIPFHTTWQHEKVTQQEANDTEYITLKQIKDVINVFNVQ